MGMDFGQGHAPVRTGGKIAPNYHHILSVLAMAFTGKGVKLGLPITVGWP
jgi:hypothetical protein